MANSLLEAKIKSVVYDEIYTPEYAVRPILKYLKYGATIWCPFDDETSQYYKVLNEAGYNVVATHIKNGYDFFNHYVECDYIISNPPYSIKDKVLKRLYELGKPFMVLLPITSLEGITRNKLYRKYGLELLVFDKRIGFLDHKTNNYFNTSYFCYNVLDKMIIFEELQR